MQVRRKKLRKNLNGVDLIIKKQYNLTIELNSNFTKGFSEERYRISYKKCFGNLYSGVYLANTKEEILRITTKALMGMSEYDSILGKYPPEPTFDNMILKIVGVEKIVTKATILDYFLEKDWIERAC